MLIASSFLVNVTPFYFWFLADHFPDLVYCTFKLDVWANLVLVAPRFRWCILLLFVCKLDVESVTYFLLDCSYFNKNFLSLCRNLKLKITVSNQDDAINICRFIDNLDRHQGPLFTIRQCKNTLTKRFMAAAVGKIHKLRREKLRELEAPSITKGK